MITANRKTYIKNCTVKILKLIIENEFDLWSEEDRELAINELISRPDAFRK